MNGRKKLFEQVAGLFDARVASARPAADEPKQYFVRLTHTQFCEVRLGLDRNNVGVGS